MSATFLLMPNAMQPTIHICFLGFLLSACSTAASGAVVEHEATAPPHEVDGLVKLREASRDFVKVEAIEARLDGVALRVPARVDFRDGALSQVGAPLPGRVIAVHVTTGDVVKVGAPLVTLECPGAAETRSGLAAAHAAAKEAEASFAREQRMLEEGVGTERDLQAAEVRRASAQAEEKRLAAAAEFVGAGSGGTIVLRASIAGTVLSRNVSVGAAVQAGQEPLVSIGDPQQLWIVAEVFERDLPFVREGAGVSVELPSSHEPIKGHVVSVGAAVASGSRTAPVRILLENVAVGLRPGMFGRARIEAAQASITVPSGAVLIKDGKDTVVYVEKAPLAFERRPVVVAQPIDGKVQVVSGLVPGDKVVTVGALLLDGSADELL